MVSTLRRRLRRMVRSMVLLCPGVIASVGACASVIGFHDASDPVKTIGWACDSGSASPLRVHLYADVDGTLVLLDSQLADRRRDDLAFVCNGSAHAFRFSDYATTAAGVALYSRPAPAAMRVQVETASGPAWLPGGPRAVSFAPVGLWDPGLVDGRWRTDFDDPREGTGEAPLLLGECAFTTPVSDGYTAFSGGGDDPATHCRYDSIVTRASNAASSDGAWPRDRYWVVTANVEPAFGNAACTDGPPGQSLPVGAPGTGTLFGLAALPDGESGRPAQRKMHLVLNSWAMGACRSAGHAIPYLAFGAQADRGNGGVITYLNSPGSKTTLTFATTLMDLAERNPAFGPLPAGAVRYRQSHVLVEAAWGGRKRWLFVELLPDARRGEAGIDPGTDAHVRFNWHMVNSFIHPGSDYVFKSAAVLSSQCAADAVAVPRIDSAKTYVEASARAAARTRVTLDLQRAFDCLQRLSTWGAEPMPSHPVPVTGIHFGIEMDDVVYSATPGANGMAPNAIWVAIDSIDLH